MELAAGSRPIVRARVVEEALREAREHRRPVRCEQVHEPLARWRVMIRWRCWLLDDCSHWRSPCRSGARRRRTRAPVRVAAPAERRRRRPQVAALRTAMYPIPALPPAPSRARALTAVAETVSSMPMSTVMEEWTAQPIVCGLSGLSSGRKVWATGHGPVCKGMVPAKCSGWPHRAPTLCSSGCSTPSSPWLSMHSMQAMGIRCGRLQSPISEIPVNVVIVQSRKLDRPA